MIFSENAEHVSVTYYHTCNLANSTGGVGGGRPIMVIRNFNLRRSQVRKIGFEPLFNIHKTFPSFCPIFFAP